MTLLTRSNTFYAIVLLVTAHFACTRSADAQELTRFETRNYIIQTDMPSNDLKPFAKHMDAVFNEYKRRFVSSGIGRDRGRGKESLFLFGKRKAYVSYMHSLGIQAENSGGMFFARNGQAGLATWVYNKPRRETIQTLQHEGFHQFAYRFIGPELPLWVNEGLAVYYEQAHLIKGKFKLGIAEPHRIAHIQKGIDQKQHFPINEIIGITSDQWFANMGDPIKGSMQYTQSWSICHFLIHGNKGRYQKAFNRYLSMIASGQRSNDAFEKAFKTNNYTALENAWKTYVHEELKPDDYSVTIDKIDFLANASLWLQKQGKTVPDTLNDLKSELQSIGFQTTRQGGHTVSAKDEALYRYTDRQGKEATFEYHIDEKTGLPILSAKRIKPSITLTWSKVGENQMYDLTFR